MTALYAFLLSFFAAQPVVHKIDMKQMKYNPAIIEIKAGDTIEWKNSDTMFHTVTSGLPNKPDGLFDSKPIFNGKSFVYKFDNPGTFDYYCRPHWSMMKGQVVVK